MVEEDWDEETILGDDDLALHLHRKGKQDVQVITDNVDFCFIDFHGKADISIFDRKNGREVLKTSTTSSIKNDRVFSINHLLTNTQFEMQKSMFETKYRFEMNGVHYAWRRCRIWKGCMKLIKEETTEVAFFRPASSMGTLGTIMVCDEERENSYVIIATLFLAIVDSQSINNAALSGILLSSA
jgi:hypothetical protein